MKNSNNKLFAHAKWDQDALEKVFKLPEEVTKIRAVPVKNKKLKGKIRNKSGAPVIVKKVPKSEENVKIRKKHRIKNANGTNVLSAILNAKKSKQEKSKCITKHSIENMEQTHIKNVDKNNIKTVLSENRAGDNRKKKIKPKQDFKTTLSSASQVSNMINSNLTNISKRKKRQLKRLQESHKNESITDQVIEKQPLPKKNKTPKNEPHLKKLKSLFSKTNIDSKQIETSSLRDKLLEKLRGPRFRYLNEQMYTTKGSEAMKMFSKDPDAFIAYHEGYRYQVNKWPLNPLDTIIDEIKKMPSSCIIGDFGCGDGRLAKSVPQIVHSFDLISMSEDVIACDMANVPLPNSTIDVAVYCLSLMGINIKDYLLEANRLLKMGGMLKIAEVSSRFEDINGFINAVTKFGFKIVNKNLSNEMFYFINLKKIGEPNKTNLPKVELKSCLYKKR